MSTQYKDFLRENPVVHQLIIESELKGEIKGELKGMREMILRTLSLRFSDALVELAKQVLSGIENVEVLYQLQDAAVISDEQDVRASLTQHLSSQ